VLLTFGNSKKISGDPEKRGASLVRDMLLIFCTSIEVNTIDKVIPALGLDTCSSFEDKVETSFSSSHFKALWT